MAPVVPLTTSQLGSNSFFRLTNADTVAAVSTPGEHEIYADINAISKDVDGQTLINTTSDNILEFSMSAPQFVSFIQRNDGSPVTAENYTSYVDNFQIGLEESAYPFTMSSDFSGLTASAYAFHAIRSAKTSDTIDVAYEDFLTAHGDFANNAAMYVSMSGNSADLSIRQSVYGNTVSAAQITGLWDTVIGDRATATYLTGTGVANPEDTVRFLLETGDAVVMGVGSLPTQNLYYNLSAVNGDMLVNMEALPAVIQGVSLEAGITAAGVDHTDDLLAAAPTLSNADVLEATSSFGTHAKVLLAWQTPPAIQLCSLKNESISGMVNQVISTSSDSFDPALDANGFIREVRKKVLEAINKDGSGSVLGMLGKEPGSSGGGAQTTTISVTVPVKGKNASAATANLQTSSAYQTVLRLRKKAEAASPEESEAWVAYGI